uniref:Uncharacterized protein n=1 Tax=Zea mays TaxID=4577 RepID=C0P6B4_MAIZE|nr:unknown [Zea mays]
MTSAKSTTYVQAGDGALRVSPRDLTGVPLEDADHLLAHVGPSVGGHEHAVQVARVARAVVERHQRHGLQAEAVLAGVHVRLEVPRLGGVHVRYEQLRRHALVQHLPVRARAGVLHPCARHHHAGARVRLEVELPPAPPHRVAVHQLHPRP